MTSLLNKDKKFQMIKKLKEEKEKKREMVVRNVKKVKSARPQSALPKNSKSS